MSKTIYDSRAILKDRLLQSGNDTLLVDPFSNKKISYNEFYNKTIRLKERLTDDYDIGNGERIVLLMDNSPEFFLFLFSAFLKNCIIIPIDPKRGISSINRLLTKINYDFLLSDGKINLEIENIIQIPEIASSTCDFNEDLYGEFPIDEIREKSPFLMTFTTGSTGEPKGVIHSSDNLIRSAVAFNEKFNFSSNNTFYHNLPMSYMAGILNLFLLPFISGSKVVIGERFSVSKIFDFWNIPIRYSVNTYWFIPTMLNLLIKLDRSDKGVNYTRDHNIIGCVGTAPLPVSTKQEFEKKYGIPLYESYGLSETLFVTTDFPGSESPPGSVGKPLSEVYLTFKDDNEILIDVPWLLLGYNEIDKEMKRKLYFSGDLGKIDQNGYLFITGRKKDIIIRGGLNISPRRIEEVLDRHHFLKEYSIIGIEDDIMGEKIICFFTTSENSFSKSSLKNINLGLIEELGNDYTIDEFIEVRSIPRFSNGKVNKIELKRNYSQTKYDSKI